jgi:hypothetical protein
VAWNAVGIGRKAVAWSAVGIGAGGWRTAARAARRATILRIGWGSSAALGVVAGRREVPAASMGAVRSSAR